MNYCLDVPHVAVFLTTIVSFVDAAGAHVANLPVIDVGWVGAVVAIGDAVSGCQDPILGDQLSGTSAEGRTAVHGGREPGEAIGRDVDAVDDVGRRPAEISAVGYIRLCSSILLVVCCRGRSGDVGGAVPPEQIAVTLEVVVVAVASDARAAVAVIGCRRRGTGSIALAPLGWRLEEVRDGQVSPISRHLFGCRRGGVCVMSVSDRRPSDGIAGIAGSLLF